MRVLRHRGGISPDIAFTRSLIWTCRTHPQDTDHRWNFAVKVIKLRRFRSELTKKAGGVAARLHRSFRFRIRKFN